MVNTGSEAGMGDESVGKEVNVSNVGVLMVDEIIVKVGMGDVRRIEVT